MNNKIDVKRNSLRIELNHLMTVYLMKIYWKPVHIPVKIANRALI